MSDTSISEMYRGSANLRLLEVWVVSSLSTPKNL
jgi:hypothetical protein